MSIESIVEAQNPWWRTPQEKPAARFPVRRDLHGPVIAHVERLDNRRALLVSGPRQVGKTVLLLQTADDLIRRGWPAANITYFDFSDDRIAGGPVSPREITAMEPAGLTANRPRVFLFDEVSRANQWAQWLKQAVDSAEGRFVVTDSAASLIREQSHESGCGRWDEMLMEGLSYSEFLRMQRPGESAEHVFELMPNAVERYLAAGGFPEHASSGASYGEVRRRLRVDVVDRAIYHDLIWHNIDVDQARRLFVYLVQDSGSIFDAAARARDLGVDPRSVRNWIRTLEDARLVVSLPRHTSYAAARLRSKPRIYAADHGLVAAFAPIPDPLADPCVRGAVVEAVVFRHLREAATRLNAELSYFRKNDRLELDFVVQLANGTVAVEVTSSADPTPKLSDLHAAARATKACRSLLVHGGAEHRVRDGILTVPLPRFLLKTDAYLTGEIRP